MYLYSNKAMFGHAFRKQFPRSSFVETNPKETLHRSTSVWPQILEVFLRCRISCTLFGPIFISRFSYNKFKKKKLKKNWGNFFLRI